jgi:dsRNA-specific ribonuclease
MTLPMPRTDNHRLIRTRTAATRFGELMQQISRRLGLSKLARQLKSEAQDVRRTLRSARSDSFESRQAERARAVERRRRQGRQAGRSRPR